MKSHQIFADKVCVTLIFTFLFNLFLAEASGLNECPLPEPELPAVEVSNIYPVGKDDDLSLEDLRRLIKEKNVKSIDELVPHLKNNRRLWTGAFRSESIREENTSCKKPRIISFSSSGELMLAWVACRENEDEKPYPDCEVLEVMENKNGKSKVIEFSFPGNQHKNLEQKAPLENQQMCLRCHGKNPSPIFESYNAWPGVFGSSSRNGIDVIQENSNEEKCYKEFINYVKSNAPPRFTALEFHHDRQAVAYDFTENMHGIVHSAISDPNARLTGIIGARSANIVLKEILSSPDIEAYKYAFYALAVQMARLQCREAAIDDFEKFFPPEMRIGKKSYAEKYIQTIQTYKSEFKQVSQSVRRDNPITTDGYAPEDFHSEDLVPQTASLINGMAKTSPAFIFATDFEYLLEQMNIDLSRPNFSKNQRYNYRTGKSTMPHLVSRAIIKMAKGCDPDFQKIDQKKFCEVLANKSRKAISALRKNKNGKSSKSKLTK